VPLFSGGNTLGLYMDQHVEKCVFTGVLESFSAGASCKFESVNFAARTPVLN